MTDPRKAGAAAIDTLLFGGGGPDGPLFIGALDALVEHMPRFAIGDVKTLVGSSVGSIIALMLGMRMTSREVEQSILEGFERGALSRLDISNLLQVPTRLGIDDGSNLVEWLASVMSARGIDRNITFRRFQQLTGIFLVIAATNLSRRQTEFMSALSTPDESVLRAIRASTAVPLIYTPVSMNGSLYIDGAFNSTSYLDVSTDPCNAVMINITDNEQAPPAAAVATAATPPFHVYVLMIFRMLMSMSSRTAPKDPRARLVVNVPSLVMSESSPIGYNFRSMSIESRCASIAEAMQTFVKTGYDATRLQIFSSNP